MELRPYQKEAHDAVFKEWNDVCSTVVVLPTGCGKTVMFADIIKTMQPKRAMVIAAREELIFQARDKIMTVAGLECGIEMGEITARGGDMFSHAPVVVATVQTLNSSLGDRTRMSKFNPKEFGVLVIDECHHAVAQTYRNVVNYFKEGNPDIKILGVSATPDRADEKALGEVFESVAFDYEILDAINDGYIVPVQQQMVYVEGLDISQVRTTAGDLNGADMAKVMEAERNLQAVASASVQIIGKRRSLVFTSTVKQAEMVCSILNRHREGMAEMVSGKTDKEDRRKILERFQAGEIQILCNCDVFTEGFDNPGVEVIIMAKLTKSRSKYAQMCGRSMRPLPGVIDGLETAEERKSSINNSAKPTCLIVDFMGNSGRHKLITTADILAGKASDAAVVRAMEKAKKTGNPVNMAEAIEQEELALKEEIKRRYLESQARKSKLVANARFMVKTVNPFDAFDISPVRERGWDEGKTLSEKQNSLLMKMGVNPDEIGYSAGRQLLNEQFRRWANHLCTVKQAVLIKKHIPHADTKNMTMKQASSIIDSIAKNGWRAPAELLKKV